MSCDRPRISKLVLKPIFDLTTFTENCTSKKAKVYTNFT